MTPSNTTPMERRCHVRPELFDLEKTAAVARSAASSFEFNPVRRRCGGLNRAPSATYLGKVYFFDSVEHRDLFDANLHRPVAIVPALVAAPL